MASIATQPYILTIAQKSLNAKTVSTGTLKGYAFPLLIALTAPHHISNRGPKGSTGKWADTTWKFPCDVPGNPITSKSILRNKLLTGRALRPQKALSSRPKQRHRWLQIDAIYSLKKVPPVFYSTCISFGNNHGHIPIRLKNILSITTTSVQESSLDFHAFINFIQQQWLI